MGKKWQHMTHHQARMIQQWKEEIVHKIASTKSNLQRIESELLPHEKDRIWRAMRARFFQKPGRDLPSQQPQQPHGVTTNETWDGSSTIATAAMAPVVPIITFEPSFSSPSKTFPPLSAPTAVMMVEETESNQDDDDSALFTNCRPPAYAPSSDCHHYYHHQQQQHLDTPFDDSATVSWSAESPINYSSPLPPSLAPSSSLSLPSSPTWFSLESRERTMEARIYPESSMPMMVAQAVLIGPNE
jgi:hypothetical protein